MDPVKELHSRFFYAKDLDIYRTEKPYSVLSDIEGLDFPSTNLEFEEADEAEHIRNIRGNVEEFSLDDHGFSFVEAPTKVTQWESRKSVEENYLPDVVELLKEKVEGVDEVEIFDWRWRDTLCSARGSQTDMYNPTDALMPASRVHLDQSPAGVLKRVRLLTGDRAEHILKGRVRVINVWRPIYNTVKDWPLAVCDGSAVTYDDMLEVDLVRQDYVGSTMFTKYRPGYRWHYLDAQGPHEVCLFKNFDSAESVKAQMCPHTSFPMHGCSSKALRRQSIEVRAFVYTYPKRSK